MGQSLVKNLVHLIFSTKHRNRWLAADIRADLYAYQAGIFKDMESPALIIGGVEDHVHALFSLSKNQALSKVVEHVKIGTSKWMKNEGPRVQEFYWQSGYAAFSVGQSNVDKTMEYIRDQERHHGVSTFEDELRLMFKVHDVEFDEQYVWN